MPSCIGYVLFELDKNGGVILSISSVLLIVNYCHIFIVSNDKGVNLVVKR